MVMLWSRSRLLKCKLIDPFHRSSYQHVSAARPMTTESSAEDGELALIVHSEEADGADGIFC